VNKSRQLPGHQQKPLSSSTPLPKQRIGKNTDAPTPTSVRDDEEEEPFQLQSDHSILGLPDIDDHVDTVEDMSSQSKTPLSRSKAGKGEILQISH
jgi:hypothetical protein